MSVWYFILNWFTLLCGHTVQIKNLPAHFPSLVGDTSFPLPSTHTLIPASSRYTELTESQAAVRAPRTSSGVSTARNTASPLDDIPAQHTPKSALTVYSNAWIYKICIHVIKVCSKCNCMRPKKIFLLASAFDTSVLELGWLWLVPLLLLLQLIVLVNSKVSQLYYHLVLYRNPPCLPSRILYI